MGGRQPYIRPSTIMLGDQELLHITRRVRAKRCNLPCHHSEYDPDGRKPTNLSENYTTFFGECPGPPATSLAEVGDLYVDRVDFVLYAKTAPDQWVPFETKHLTQSKYTVISHPTLGSKIHLRLQKGVFLWSDSKQCWDARPRAMGPKPTSAQEAVRQVLDLSNQRAFTNFRNALKHKEARRRKTMDAHVGPDSEPTTVAEQQLGQSYAICCHIDQGSSYRD